MSDPVSEILHAISTIETSSQPILIAIDGRCCSGKTTLAGKLKEKTGCNVIHMDDFFLRPEQRTPERYSEPGGNVDYERFLGEVMEPLAKNQPFSFCPYSCKLGRLTDPVQVQPSRLTIIEGSYSCHPMLWDFYDLRAFMNVDKDEQLRRITARNGKEAAVVFSEKWIPLEEAYFKAYNIAERCDLSFQM